MKHIIVAFTTLLASVGAMAQPSIAVTDLAYTKQVSESFFAGAGKESSNLSANRNVLAATHQASATYVAGTYNYVEQRELGSFTNDIKGALLKGTNFRLVQGKMFDAGAQQPTKAEQALNQIQTGKMVTPVAQPQVHDIISRIKKGEFSGADYVLFGTLTSLQFRDTVSPIQGTGNASHIFSLDLVADFSLISTKTYEIRASFSAQGEASEVKLLSNRGDVLPPNRGKVIRETSKSLAANVFEQFSDQLGVAESAMAKPVRSNESGGKGVINHKSTTTTESVTILK